MIILGVYNLPTTKWFNSSLFFDSFNAYCYSLDSSIKQNLKGKSKQRSEGKPNEQKSTLNNAQRKLDTKTYT